MRDILAFCSLLACVVILAGSVIALVKPIPRIWLPTRKRALGGVAIAFGLFIFTAIVIPLPQEKNVAAPPPRTANRPTSARFEPNKQQDGIISFMRNAVMQTVVCKGDLDMTQAAIDKLAAGRARPIDVYEEAKRGIKSCTDASIEFSRQDLFNSVDRSNLALAQKAISACDKAARERKSAMGLAQKLLESGGRLESVSRYLELKTTAASHETSCRLDLMGIADRSKIPEGEVDFAAI